MFLKPWQLVVSVGDHDEANITSAIQTIKKKKKKLSGVHLNQNLINLPLLEIQYLSLCPCLQFLLISVIKQKQTNKKENNIKPKKSSKTNSETVLEKQKDAITSHRDYQASICVKNIVENNNELWHLF